MEPVPFSDEDLVRRILRGETDFFEHVIKRYERLVYGFMLRKISDTGVAQDLAQETFLISYENLERLKDHARLKSWIMGIAGNLVRDHYKRRKLAGMPEGMDVELTGLDPLQSIEQQERHEYLYKALMQLSERYRAVLIKRYLEGREYNEIAEDLGLSVGAVEVCMHRARKALASVMKEFLPEGDI
ncbi:MAG: RNA polymerase sigma factor [Planctomycetes bacterium]|nr:RNA polymerase sigma factor [Planctomycetota bacterium]MCW8134627.1 RNA polymerase sigma factor [Planctomycetota bacterium]